MIPFITITVAVAGIVAFKVWGATGEELHSASEQTTTVCHGLFGCSMPGAMELLAITVLVLIGALIISVPQRFSSGGEE